MAGLTISTTAGDPPSAIVLLERYAQLGCQDELTDVLRDCRDWCATVLQSHASHPSLIYFRTTTRLPRLALFRVNLA